MTEATEFKRYRVLPRKKGRVPLVGIHLSDLVVFDVEVQLGHWEEFEGDVLRERYGKTWPSRLKREVKRGLFRIVGVDEAAHERGIMLDEAGGVAVEEVPETEAPDDAPIVESLERESDPPPVEVRGGRNPGTGLRLLARHLKDECGIRNHAEMLTLLEDSKIPWIQLALHGRKPMPAGVSVQIRWKAAVARLAKAYSNGKKAHAEGCPFCDDGLPPPLNELVTAYKRARSESS